MRAGEAGPLAPALQRPRWRGWLHGAAFLVSLPAGVALCLAAGSTSARIAAAVYAVTLSAVFGMSAAFHLGAWSPPVLLRMSRLDRAMIYLLIAGTFTPVSLLGLRPGWALAVLAIMWAGAVAGVAVALAWRHVRGLGFALYLVPGWPVGLLILPRVLDAAHRPGLALLAAGGVVYTAGAIMLACRWPDPSPRVFGYHEVWHALTIVAASCHWTAIWFLVR
jgi:hemolysin III